MNRWVKKSQRQRYQPKQKEAIERNMEHRRRDDKSSTKSAQQVSHIVGTKQILWKDDACEYWESTQAK